MYKVINLCSCIQHFLDHRMNTTSSNEINLVVSHGDRNPNWTNTFLLEIVMFQIGPQAYGFKYLYYAYSGRQHVTPNCAAFNGNKL